MTSDYLCHYTQLPGTKAVALCGASTLERTLHAYDEADPCEVCGRPRCQACLDIATFTPAPQEDHDETPAI